MSNTLALGLDAGELRNPVSGDGCILFAAVGLFLPTTEQYFVV